MALKSLGEEGFKNIFYNSLSPMLIIDTDAPTFTMLDVNDAYLRSTNTTREALVGKPVFGVFPGNPTDMISKNIERAIFSFEHAIKNKIPHVMSNYRYDIPIPGSDDFEERYWTTSNTPILNEKGDVVYFIHSPTDVTELNKLAASELKNAELLQAQQKQLYSTFMQAPVGIGIFKGPDFVVDLANPSLCEIYGKTQQELMGKPIFDVLEHARGQGFEELLESVRLTGKPFKGNGYLVPMFRDNELANVYVNFVYEPFRETDGTISGVIAVATDVSEQAVARNMVAEAEERARLAVDAVGLGTFDLDLVSTEIVTTEKFAHIFGFDKPVTRTEYVSVFHPDDLEVRTTAHEAALVTGKLFYEARVLWKDGSVHWVRVEGKVFYNEAGKGIRILGTLLDISEQRNYKEEQRKLISLVENSVDLMSVLDMNGFNSYINEAGKKLLGFETEEEIKTTPISQLHAPEHFELVQQEVLPSVMTRGSWAGTMLVKHLQSGEVFPVFNNCFRIDDPVSNLPIAVGAVMRDLRPEEAAKKAIADSEQLLRNITSAAPTALWMSDETGAVIYNNQTWLDWTGKSYEENLGSGWASVIHEDDVQRVKEKFATETGAGKFYETEFRINHADGSIHWCIANGRPQFRPDGSFSGYIGACIDITELKQLEQQKDDFIGIASHELKTPVTSIKSYTQLLQQMLEEKGNATEAGMMGRIDKQVNRLTSLIADLLDVTKINSGRLQFNDTLFEFRPMVQDLLEDLRRTSPKHVLAEDLQDTGFVYGDRERIGQVITNLVNNAVKYSPHANKIIIHSAIKNNEVNLCVEDFGIGIAEKNLGKVFEQFYRVSGDKQHTFPGLGLGLYISSEIIKRESGRIWVTSSFGKGSVFCFSLPMSKITDPE